MRAPRLGLFILIIFLVGLGLAALGVVGRLRRGSGQVTRLTVSLLRPLIAWPAGVPHALLELHSLQAERDQLATELVRLSVENTALKEKNVTMAAQAAAASVQFSDPVVFRLGARVVGREPDPLIQELKLDRGSADGIKVGQAVLTAGVIVARIRDVLPHESTALVLGSHLSVLQVRHETSRQTALVRGDVAGLELQSFPLETTLNSGDRIVTSGLDGIVPGGILVGTVDRVLSNQSSFLQTAKLNQAISARQVELVEVVGR